MISSNSISGNYTTPLSLTSQFFFCGLPLRLDSYRGCAFQCSFCYARYRGGNSPVANLAPADPNTLQRIFELSFRQDRPAGIIGQFLQHRVPIHFGGMSDPFQPAEQRFGVTRRFLETLIEFEYPTVISTRSTMPSAEPYLSLLEQMKHVVLQFSFVSTREEVSRRLEPHTPAPAELLASMEKLANRGIPVMCRWQPYVPGTSEPAREFVQRISAAGARHVAIEHLKLPVETNHPLWRDLVKGAGRDLRDYYESVGARLDGRELVLPAQIKLPAILQTRDAAHEKTLSFGAADNEFQYLSDHSCCCSGVDQFPGFDGWFKHQFAHAVRRSCGGRILYESIAGYWTPKGSVNRWLNSNSRIGSGAGAGTLEEHIRVRWNSATSSLGPGSFYGVEATDEFTPEGFRVFRWREEALPILNLLHPRRSRSRRSGTQEARGPKPDSCSF